MKAGILCALASLRETVFQFVQSAVAGGGQRDEGRTGEGTNQTGFQAFGFRASSFLRISIFGFRVSRVADFGLRISPAEGANFAIKQA